MAAADWRETTQIMLKHEALLAQVADPGAGSYFLEAITDSIAREAWKTMQQIDGSRRLSKSTGDRRVGRGT